MIDFEAVRLENIDFAAQGAREVYENLRVLYTTPAGTVPLDREFGIDISVLDEPINIAQGRLIVEYTQKTRRYEPRANVREIFFDADELTGKLIPRVVIDIELEQSS